MSIHVSIAIIIVVIMLVVAWLSFKYLSRRWRLGIYGVILIAGVSTLLYIQFNVNPAGDFSLELVASGLDEPVQASWSPGNADRFFVVSRKGFIHIMLDNVLQQPPFLDISDQVNFSSSEQGLLSVAFHPGFAQNGVFYIYYTGLDGSVILARYSTLTNNHDLADPESAIILLTVPKVTEHHNGGTLLFGSDGYLYVSIGDDGEYEQSVAQKLNNYLGKILRLDVSDLGVPYKIPADNPFVNIRNALPEIWAYGLRNPWRMVFDAQTGDLYIADVGLLSREEVNFQPAGKGAGANYGWPWFEGNKAMKIVGADTVDADDFVFPVIDYDHTSLGGCAIIGGDVYYGNSLPQIKGKYLFSDYCYGFIWALEVTEKGKGRVETLMRDPNLHPSAFAVDSYGEIYVLDVGAGKMFKLIRK